MDINMQQMDDEVDIVMNEAMNEAEYDNTYNNDWSNADLLTFFVFFIMNSFYQTRIYLMPRIKYLQMSAGVHRHVFSGTIWISEDFIEISKKSELRTGQTILNSRAKSLLVEIPAYFFDGDYIVHTGWHFRT